MWISVAAGALGAAEVLLPGELWTEGPRQMQLRYGVQEREVLVRSGGTPASGLGETRGTTRLNPVSVQASPELIAELGIRTEPVYRLKIAGDMVEIGPVLGLLLGQRNHWYDHEYMSREAARVTDVYPRTGGLFCAFSVRTVSTVDRCAYGLFFNPITAHWDYARLPLPAAMHRRSFHNDQAGVDSLRLEARIRIVNSRRFSKWELFEILGRDPAFRAFLPDTRQVQSPQDVLAMAQAHPALILKPANLSRGRGILCLDRVGKRFRLTDFRSPPPRRSLVDHDRLAHTVQSELLGQPYLCQQRIDLAQIDGAPFDVRVVMQRRTGGDWACSGIECRVAGQGSKVTNIAFGGRALWFADAMRLSFGPAVDADAERERVVGVARRVCELLDQTGEDFAEFGLDLAFDTRGRVWLIEANVLPTFHGFAVLDPRLSRSLLAAPLLYASEVAGFGPTGEGE